MKRPRDLLLERHADAQPRLDALRREVVAEHVVPVSPASVSPPPGGLARFWDELFWTSRRAWTALAAAWVAILALNLATHHPASPSRDSRPPGRSARAVSDLRPVLFEQARLRAELLENHSLPATESPPAATPGPRSEQRSVFNSTAV